MDLVTREEYDSTVEQIRIEYSSEVSTIGIVEGNDEEMFIRGRISFRFFPNANGSAGMAIAGDVIRVSGRIYSIDDDKLITIHRCTIQPIVRIIRKQG